MEEEYKTDVNVVKNGTSLYILLPPKFQDYLDLKEKDEVKLVAGENPETKRREATFYKKPAETTPSQNTL